MSKSVLTYCFNVLGSVAWIMELLNWAYYAHVIQSAKKLLPTLDIHYDSSFTDTTATYNP